MTIETRQDLGRWGEEVAVLAYALEGYACVARRWRRAVGELDLVLRRDGILVFAEVKTRRGLAFGRPEEAVDARRLGRMRHVARHYLHEETPRGIDEYRFDVVAVEVGPGAGRLQVRILPGVV